MATNSIAAGLVRLAPWYYGWNIIAVAILFQALTFGICFYSFTFWIAPWSEEFSVGRGDVMLVFLALNVGMGLLAPLAGRAVDRFSLRWLITFGASSLALGLWLAARADSLWSLKLIYASLIVAGPLLAGPLIAQTLATRWFNLRRGMAIGIVTVGTSVGGFLAPPVVTELHAAVGWRDANDLLALALLLLILPPVWLLVRDRPSALGLVGERPLAEAAQESTGLGRMTTRDILTNRLFWVTVCMVAPMVTAFGGAQHNLAPYAEDQGISATATAWLVSVLALVMVASKVFFGAMADRYPLRRLFLCANLGLLAALLLMTLPLTYGMLLMICILLGFVGGGFLPLIGALVSQNFDLRTFGLVMGMLGPFTTLAAAGPWLAGHIRDQAGSYDPAWVGLALLLIPAMFATVFLRPRAPVNPPAA